MPRAAKVAVEKKVKAKKDPNAPKKGLSGFMFFSQEQRPIVKEENPKASFGDLGKIVGEKWRNLDDSEKEPYQKKAEADKARYEREAAAYKATGSTGAGTKKSPSPAPKSPKKKAASSPSPSSPKSPNSPEV